VDIKTKDEFIKLWKKYFNNAELPITFYYYNDSPAQAEIVRPGSLSRCVIGALAEVRNGRSLSFNANSIGCPGGKKYLGFAEDIMPDFEFFLSCGIPGKLRGELYKKSPELVKAIMKDIPAFKAPGSNIVFKRWDNLTENDTPEVVIFFAPPDVLSGLFTLINFDSPGLDGVFAPFSSGCSSVVTYPYLEKDSSSPRAVLGMFDPSARPYFPNNVLGFAVHMKKFKIMIENMTESFLITTTWKTLQKRI
jgi:uncharacterized protein (DUF169 family)